MAWREQTVADKRWEFVQAWLKGEVSKTQLCRRFGISRKAGYKWAARHAAQGRAGLVDASRAPHHQARASEAAVVAGVCASSCPSCNGGWATMRRACRRWSASSSASG